MAVKKRAAKKRAVKREPEQLYTLELSKTELEHIRDIFSVLIPATDQDLTISGALAEMKEQLDMEEELWKKLATTFEAAGILTDEAAPDFVIATTTGLYQIDQDGDE